MSRAPRRTLGGPLSGCSWGAWTTPVVLIWPDHGLAIQALAFAWLACGSRVGKHEGDSTCTLIPKRATTRWCVPGVECHWGGPLGADVGGATVHPRACIAAPSALVTGRARCTAVDTALHVPHHPPSAHVESPHSKRQTPPPCTTAPPSPSQYGHVRVAWGRESRSVEPQ